MSIDNPRSLPGFIKKSFCINFNGGEIWFEHLDGIYEHSDLVLEKLAQDRIEFCRPSQTSIVGFVMDETTISPVIVDAIKDVLCSSTKSFQRVCFIGTDRKSEKAIKKALINKTFALNFINDLEKAKEWLVSERY